MSNPFGHSYPAGAENDPRNQRDPDSCEVCHGQGRHECHDCDGAGCDECACNKVVDCSACDGTGEQHEPSREERAIEKADRDMDAAKDEPREED